MSITLAAARLGAILGNIIFGVFVDVACAIPILLVATLLICKSNLLIPYILLT
jgi:VNT family MFS transporter (synaptic vesicle glycoprotein 2)